MQLLANNMKKRTKHKKHYEYKVIDSSKDEVVLHVFKIDGFFFGENERQALAKALAWISEEENLEEGNITLERRLSPNKE